MQDVPQVCSRWEADVRHDDTGHGPWKKVVKFDCTGSFMGNQKRVIVTQVRTDKVARKIPLKGKLIVIEGKIG